MAADLIVSEPGLQHYLDAEHNLSVSYSTIRRLEHRGDFPKRCKLPFRRVAWQRRDVDAWAHSVANGGAQ